MLSRSESKTRPDVTRGSVRAPTDVQAQIVPKKHAINISHSRITGKRQAANGYLPRVTRVLELFVGLEKLYDGDAERKVLFDGCDRWSLPGERRNSPVVPSPQKSHAIWIDAVTCGLGSLDIFSCVFYRPKGEQRTAQGSSQAEAWLKPEEFEQK